MADNIPSNTLELLWNSMDETWGGFDIEQVIGSMPKGVFKKAQELQWSKEFHDIFFTLLWKQLNEKERERLMQSVNSGWKLE